MSLVIRLMRTGKRGERKFRVIVKEKRSKRDGKAVELLGWLEKTTTETKKVLNKERITYWLSQGAQATDAVKKALL